MRTTRPVACAVLIVSTAARADGFYTPPRPYMPPPSAPMLHPWHPLVQRDRLNDRITIYQSQPGNPYMRDYSAPTTRIERGTMYETNPGGGSRDWFAPAIDLD